MLYTNISVGKPKNSEIEIKGEIPADVLMDHYEAILEEARRDFEAPGFRKGNVPMNIFRAQVHEHRVLEDAAERALQEAYPAIIEEHELKVIGRPQVHITKLASGNPAGFTLTVGLMPEFKLPDYKKIAKEVLAERKPVEVSESEVDEVIMTLRKLRAPAGKEEDKDAAESQLPELTDEFVKTLGNFENVADFRAKLTDNIRAEKEEESRRGARENIAAKLIEKSKIELPKGLVEEEAETMISQLLADLGNAGLSMEDYLKRTGKTAEQFAEENRGYAERQLATRFILQGIAEAENIQPDPDALETEVKLMAERYPDLERARIESYISRLMTNEKVLEILENPDGGKKE